MYQFLTPEEQVDEGRDFFEGVTAALADLLDATIMEEYSAWAAQEPGAGSSEGVDG